MLLVKTKIASQLSGTDKNMEQAESYRVQGNEEYRKGNYLSAIDFYTQGINAEPNHVAYYGNRSACYFMLKKYQESLQDCNRALELDPNFVKSLQRAGKVHLIFGNFDQSKSFLDRALAIEPNNEAIKSELRLLEETIKNYNMIRNMKSSQQYTQALYFLDKVLEQSPEKTDLKLIKLDLFIETGKLDRAHSFSTEILSAYSQDPDYLLLRGKCFYYKGLPDQAKKHLTEALKFDPDHEGARNMLKMQRQVERFKEEGNKLFSEGNTDSAIDAYTQALEVDPKNKNLNSIILANRAACYMKKKEYMLALADCNKSIESNPEYTKAFMRRGNVHSQLENFEDALRDYNTVKQKDPNYTEIDNIIRFAQSEAKKAKRKDYYKILDIEKSANDQEIKKAYRKMALKWHPDKNSESEESKLQAEKKFKDIAEAYAILTDATKRQQYDSGMDIEEIEQGGGFGGGFPGGFGGGVDPSQIFQMFFGGGGGGGFEDMGGFNRMGGHRHGSSGGGAPPGFKFSYRRG